MKVAPTVTIAEATNITANSVTVSSTITSEGGTEVLSSGVCWSTNANPTIADSKTSEGTGTGTFTSSITGFTAVPGGCRRYNGAFNNIGRTGYWWSSSAFNTGSALYYYMDYNFGFVLSLNYFNEGGFLFAV